MMAKASSEDANMEEIVGLRPKIVFVFFDHHEAEIKII